MGAHILKQATSLLDTLKPPCGFPIYTSMDIRDDGERAAAVDVNLFPAGFNNVSTEAKSLATQRMKDFFVSKLQITHDWTVTIVPEAHTNNLGYLENLADLIDIVQSAGAKVKLLWPGSPIPKPWLLSTKSGRTLQYLPAEEALTATHVLLLNHDLSGGLPEAIRNYKGPIFPNPKLGWYRRKKSNHFEIAEALLQRLSEEIPKFDPWQYSIASHSLGNLDMDKREDIRKVIEEGRAFFSRLKQKYKEKGLQKEPYIFLKNDAGTYGMGVMSFLSENELDDAESKIRKKMRIGKESVKIDRVIFQEGLASHYSCPKENAFAEPVIYAVDGFPIGGFYRVQRKTDSDMDKVSLNQPGSTLEPLDAPMKTARSQKPLELLKPGQLYHFITTLHTTAAGLEECP